MKNSKILSGTIMLAFGLALSLMSFDLVEFNDDKQINAKDEIIQVAVPDGGDPKLEDNTIKYYVLNNDICLVINRHDSPGVTGHYQAGGKRFLRSSQTSLFISVREALCC